MSIKKLNTDDFEKFYDKRKAENAATITELTKPRPVDTMTENVLVVCQVMARKGQTDIAVRDVVKLLDGSGASVPDFNFTDSCRYVNGILRDELKLHRLVEFPAVYQMPYRLPVIENGFIITPVVLLPPPPPPPPPAKPEPTTIAIDDPDFFPQRGRDY